MTNADRKQNGGAIQPLIAVSISCTRRVELIGYFVRFGHLLLLRISLSKQKRITS